MRVFVRILLLWLLCAVPLATLAIAVTPPALAQTEISAADYETWKGVAARAETAVAEARASDPVLEELRRELVAWRTRFQDSQGVNSEAIATVKAQITALGPAPENGVEEAEIAAQREELNTKLATLQAPVKAAEVAYSRADGLIRNIDTIIRERQASALLELKPSPLNPALWPEGLQTLTASVLAIGNEAVTALANPTQRDKARANLPAILVLILFAFVVLLRGRNWMEGLSQRVQEKDSTAARWLAGFVLSLGQIALPVIGLVAFTQALSLTGLVGLRSADLLSALPLVGFGLFSAIWLGARIFPRSEVLDSPVLLSPEQRREGRLYSGVLGLLIAVQVMLRIFAKSDGWSDEAQVVVFFPVFVLIGVLLLRLGHLLSLHGEALSEGDESASNYRSSVTRLMARLVMLIGVVGPLLAAAGYFGAAQFVMIPTVLSLQLMAFLVVLHRLLIELYVLISGNRDGLNDSLVPIVIATLLILVAGPVLALIWGARLADLSELWTRFRDGFSLGGVNISPTVFITFAVVFLLGFMITRVMQSALRGTVLPKTRMDKGAQNAIVSGIGYIGIFLAALAAITGAGIDLSSLAIVAGALSVGIGFGLQNIVSNFVSGIILLIERPISEGDWIEVGGKMGYVRNISVRSTRIETFDRTDVIVPNADFVSGMVTNFTRGNTVGRVIVPVGVAYGSDTRKIEKILREIAEAHPMVVMQPPPSILFQGFGADSMDFEIRAILRDVNWVSGVKSDMNHEIARRFAEEDVEIPFAQRDLWLRNPEVLRASNERGEPKGADDRAAPENGEEARHKEPPTAVPGTQPDSPPDPEDAPDGDSR